MCLERISSPSRRETTGLEKNGDRQFPLVSVSESACPRAAPGASRTPDRRRRRYPCTCHARASLRYTADTSSPRGATEAFLRPTGCLPPLSFRGGTVTSQMGKLFGGSTLMSCDCIQRSVREGQPLSGVTSDRAPFGADQRQSAIRGWPSTDTPPLIGSM